MTEKFEKYLLERDLSDNTIRAYLYALRQFKGRYTSPTKRNLREHKDWLTEHYRPRTVNLRLRAINCYLESIGKENLRLKFIRIQQKSFAEKVISEADYEYFKTRLKEEGELADSRRGDDRSFASQRSDVTTALKNANGPALILPKGLGKRS